MDKFKVRYWDSYNAFGEKDIKTDTVTASCLSHAAKIVVEICPKAELLGVTKE